MNNDKVALTMKDILEKEFKIDARGYRMQEVDQYLDIIIRDYNGYNNIIKELREENEKLVNENNSLKQEVRSLKSSIEALDVKEKEVTNVDLLKRISKLEKIILGHEE
jgi:DivIVA domain-containing protein